MGAGMKPVTLIWVGQLGQTWSCFTTGRSQHRPRPLPRSRNREQQFEDQDENDNEEEWSNWLPGLELHPHSRLQRALSYD